MYSELHPVFVEQQARVEVVPGIHHQLEAAEAELTLAVGLRSLDPLGAAAEQPEVVEATAYH